MAAINFDDYGDHPDGGSLTALLNWAGALLSILLIAGLATWGWKLWVRDVTGVPVVRALEGPMRVAPVDPGGLASNYQGLTVNRIAEERVEVAPSDQVVLAPQPTTLDEDEDLAMAALPAVEAEAEVEESAVVATNLPSDALAPLAENDSDTAVLAIEEIEAMAPVLPDTATEETILPAEQELSATDLAVRAALGDIGMKPEPALAKIEAAAHVPVVTPRPEIRPTGLQRVSLPAVDPVNGEVNVQSIPVGTRLVQLGAFGSADDARQEWANAQARFGDYMVGKDRVVQEASTGGRSFYRLRALGFDNLADARRFCAVLVADGANCIPVVHE
ncbi:MAG: SPOR domain-containing protein [Silicimonas sp.]|nr:SPOR domain-containing protein [Silicimonas sp.]